MLIEIIFIEILLLLIALNLIASYKVVRYNYLDKKQKFVQITILWILPVIGSFLITHLLNDGFEATHLDSTGNTTGMDTSGVWVGSSYGGDSSGGGDGGGSY